MPFLANSFSFVDSLSLSLSVFLWIYIYIPLYSEATRAGFECFQKTSQADLRFCILGKSRVAAEHGTPASAMLKVCTIRSGASLLPSHPNKGAGV